jgi:adenine C2-methylase RlmN of 23S rRNA A2503 and tRNA A37
MRHNHQAEEDDMEDIAAIPFTALRSSLDSSINFSRQDPRGGMVETRFVQRVPERFIVYISSMLGCDKACRFCHLTQTGQTNATCLSEDEMVEQARTVLAEVGDAGASTVHFNFMARGEPMSNPSVNRNLFVRLAELASSYGLASRIKISSILPMDTWTNDPRDLHADGCPPVDFYYSLYSTDADWRRRWIPKAMRPFDAMAWLRNFQKVTGQRVILHWALIDGENDSVEDARSAAALAKLFGVQADFNLVRYNPANGKSREASEERIQSFLKEMDGGVHGRIRMIPRVGADVAASCGCFLAPGMKAKPMTDQDIDLELETRFGISKEVSSAMVAEMLLNGTEETPSYRPRRIAGAIRDDVANSFREAE